MTHIVTGFCIGCKCGNCAAMCPVEAFRVGEVMVYIDPESCVDCEACVGACVRHAIFHADDVPLMLDHYIKINATFAPQSDVINESQQPLDFPDWSYGDRLHFQDRNTVA